MRILEFLGVQNWTQTELAEKLGTSMPNVNKWVKGSGVPSYDMCKKLLQLGMSVEDLFDIDDYQPIQTTKPITTDEFKKRFNEAMAEWVKEHPPKPGSMTAEERKHMNEIDPYHDADFDN